MVKSFCRKSRPLLVLAILGLTQLAWADLASERQALEQGYRAAIPQIKPEDYVLGTLAFSPQARHQVESLMTLPPYEIDLDAARDRWNKPFKNGKNFASCFPEAGQGAALTYPRFDQQKHRVETFEEALNQCLINNSEQPLSLEDKNLGMLSIQGKSLFNGRPVQIKVEGPAAQAAWEAGRLYYHKPRGPQQMSCASCHVQAVGKVMGGNAVSPLIGQGTHWPEFRNGGATLVTLQQRFMQCNRGLGDTVLKAGSETYNNLEYYVTSLSNGLPVRVPVIRP